MTNLYNHGAIVLRGLAGPELLEYLFPGLSGLLHVGQAGDRLEDPGKSECHHRMARQR